MSPQTHRTGVIAALMLLVALLGAPAALARSTSSHPPATAAAGSREPTLGLAHRFTEGFGRVRPRTVGYGGDETSLLADVHWSSWGSAQATGEGTADWVWPGWCVACGSVSLHATVLAFDLRTCAGHLAYSQLEWYFPTRGMRFSPRLSFENVCDMRPSTQPPPPPHARCSAIRIPGARVTRIQVFGAGMHCADARRLIPTLHLLGHYGHNARFHVGPWWCGSELAMQDDRLPPQDFSCEAGDQDAVWLSVTRTG
jgi:hypothetical protein